MQTIDLDPAPIEPAARLGRPATTPIEILDADSHESIADTMKSLERLVATLRASDENATATLGDFVATLGELRHEFANLAAPLGVR